MASAAQAQSPLDRKIAAARDVFALFRDLVLVLLFLLLLVAPTFIGERLSAAGFEEGSMMGFKWKKKAIEFGDSTRHLQQALDDAQRQLALQAETLKKNQDTILQLGQKSGDASTRALAEQNSQVLARTAAVRQSTAATLKANAEVVDQARELAGDARWAVVIGGDPTLAPAEYEAGLAQRRGLGDADIYLRQRWYRTVVKVADRKAGESVLKAARSRNPSAYMVDLETWCPNPVRQGEIFACG